jgi:hypothetical protein
MKNTNSTKVIEGDLAGKGGENPKPGGKLSGLGTYRKKKAGIRTIIVNIVPLRG